MCNYKNRQFISAVRNGNVCVIKRLLRNRSVDINFYTKDCGTALHVAVMRNNLYMVKLLLRYGAKMIQVPHRCGDSIELLSPLWLSVLHYRHDIADLLIDAGADVNQPLNTSREETTFNNFESTTLLHVAITNRDCNLICKLLRAGANANACNSKSESVLQLAIESACPDWIVESLIDCGASATHSTVTGKSVLHYAIRAGRSSLTGLLMDHGADPFDAHFSGKTSLYFAANAKVENTRIAEMLIDEGIPIDAADKFTLFTPLHMAVKTGKRDMVRLLLKHGANVSAKTQDGSSPLYLAIEEKNPQIVEALLSHGADANEIMNVTLSMLHCACTIESKEIIKLLLKHGADVNVKDCVERTPLMMIEDFDSEAAMVMIKQCISLSDGNPELINEDNLNMIMDNVSLAKLYNGCLQEIEKMKKTVIYNGITYYQVFTRSEDRIAALLRNEEFVENLAWLEHDYLFPLYTRELGDKLLCAERIRDTKWAMEHYINGAFCFRMPFLVIDKIIGYLNPEDLCL